MQFFRRDTRFFLIAGPCAIENQETVMETAGTLKEVCGRLGIDLIFKSSFDKANRTSISGARGVGLEEGMKTFDEISEFTEENLKLNFDVNKANKDILEIILKNRVATSDNVRYLVEKDKIFKGCPIKKEYKPKM